MRKFMDKDFLLMNDTAKELFFNHAKDMPIFDYHCHLIPSQIAEDKRFTTITEAWLGGDHYKWRAMRSNGVNEELITGNADPFDKFMAWAGTMENLIGNPLYHWTHLELQRYVGIYDVLNRKNARKIYDEANEKFADDPELSVFGIMKKFNVYAVGTTDDPADDLAMHQKEIKSVDDVVEALVKRLEFFVSLGCRATDHALVYCPHTFWTKAEVDKVLQKKLYGNQLTDEEADAYITYVLYAMAKEYKRLGIVMQLHFASIRDNNTTMFRKLGPDTGYDASYDGELAKDVSTFFSHLSAEDMVPKTIFYSLNPKDYYSLGTLMGCYQGDGIPGKMQLGSGWWFCDHKDGMYEQMKVLGNLGLLSRFVGMLTDSRSFLSYSRHEYFRRILCNLIGTWAEDGEIFYDEEQTGRIVEDICFNNAKNYFEG